MVYSILFPVGNIFFWHLVNRVFPKVVQAKWEMAVLFKNVHNVYQSVLFVIVKDRCIYPNTVAPALFPRKINIGLPNQ